MFNFGSDPAFEGSGGGFFGFVTTIFPIMFIIVFIIVMGGILYTTTNHLRNTRAKEESSYAKIVGKRMEVRNGANLHQNQNGLGQMNSSSRTYYYITLEFDDGTRREYLDVKGLYGLVVEGDSGYAATKRQWIVAFERSAV
ncbi:DUF2500 domain-containing protein [Paenibacillus sp. GCM10027627]|uniref:DUF2500 domain-containing protein n=1 Tax=unclassified Paenibacillus TaxID=185978 RepID=UPI00362724DD